MIYSLPCRSKPVQLSSVEHKSSSFGECSQRLFSPCSNVINVVNSDSLINHSFVCIENNVSHVNESIDLTESMIRSFKNLSLDWQTNLLSLIREPDQSKSNTKNNQ